MLGCHAAEQEGRRRDHASPSAPDPFSPLPLPIPPLIHPFPVPHQVLIVGLRGVGVETAKNLILAGPGAVTLWDEHPTQLKDLGSNFFLTEADVGKPRAGAVASKLAELNSMVSVRVQHGPLTEAVVGTHNVVVCTGMRLAEMVRWDEFCHARSIAFIAANVKGAMGFVFSDFGPKFTVRDVTGENPHTRIITHIENDEEGTVTLLSQEDGGRSHGIEESEHDGWVEISDVSGMECVADNAKSVSDLGPFKIKHVFKTVVEDRNGTKREKKVYDGFKLAIGDTRAFSAYKNGGVLTQVKKPVQYGYRTLAQNLAQPVAPGEFGLLFTDGAKFGRAEQLHLALQGLWKFEEAHGRAPRPNDEGDAAEVLRLTQARNAELKALGDPEAALALEEVEESVVTSLALFADVDFQPLAAFFGGVVAQEVVKFTGKYQPLKQWLHLDAFEALPATRPSAAETAPQNTRYDDLVALYGKSFVQERIANARTFVVGCGALGCEYLKNFALLGLGTGPRGGIVVTDNDRIEVSNLNRQFLFREKNVGQAKSVAATEAALHMNSAMKIEAKEELVATTTENVFPDQLWEGLDFVTNALDNVKARLYVDSRCVFYGKPLLESGTLGTKCNVQVIIPHLTASYADGPKDDADGDTIPMCTLRNFPSLIEHCIEWARAQFNDLFVEGAADAKKFLEDRALYLEDAKAALRGETNGNGGNSGAGSRQKADLGKEIDALRGVQAYLAQARGLTFPALVAEAFSLFHKLFRDKLLQLIHNFPEDHVTSNGDKFWTGAKRFPQPAVFDAEKEQHLGFVVSVANLLAVNYGLVESPDKTLIAQDHRFRDLKYIKGILASLPVPAWTPSNEKIELEEEKKEGEAAGEEGGEVAAGTNGGSSASAGKEDAMDVESVQQQKEQQQHQQEAEERATLEGLIAELEAVDAGEVVPEPAEFEKDQDLNFHIDFVTAACNLRASNYRIKQASRHKCKMIAGKIIPAIATATAAVTGLACIELLKVLQGKPLDAFKDSSNNLGLNMYFLQEPAPPAKTQERYDEIEMAHVKPYPADFTKWDRIVIEQGPLTLGGFLEAFKKQTGLNITLLFHKASGMEGPQKGRFLYNSEEYLPANKQLYSSKLETDLAEWVLERYEGAPVEIVGPHRKYLELETSAADDEGNPFLIPTVIYRWAH